VRPERFELPASSSGGKRSIQLSYGRAPSVYIGSVGAFNRGLGRWRFQILSKRERAAVMVKCRKHFDANQWPPGISYLSITKIRCWSVADNTVDTVVTFSD
jgi:hypothetical protein